MRTIILPRRRLLEVSVDSRDVVSLWQESRGGDSDWIELSTSDIDAVCTALQAAKRAALSRPVGDESPT